MKMMKKKVIISSAAVLVLAIAVYFIFLGSSTRKYDFRFDKVTKGDVNVVVTTTGTINAVVSVDVGTQVSGIISNLYADFNSVVKEGQVIARIDTTFLVQSVNDAEAALDGAKAKAADSKRTLVRETALLAKGLDSQAAYDAALTADESNQAALKQAIASLDRAKINLAYATIMAPISGVVINRAVNVGQTVAASFSSPLLYTIANDLAKMQVWTTVDETDIGMISLGQSAAFTVDAYPDQKFNGVVSQIRLAPVTIQNVVNYTVVIDVDNHDLKLMPGMTANVNIAVANAHDVLKVSSLALRFQPPGDLVDSAKLQAQREGFLARGGSGGDSSGAGFVGRSATDSGGKGPSSVVAGSHGSFGAIRDSIQAAHGGKLNQQELRAEMGKVFAKNRVSQQAVWPAQGNKNVSPSTSGTMKYGIVNLYPQFQKSPYVAQHQSGRARVWILNAQRKLEAVFVRTGVTDGRYTEITSNNLKPGDQIVLGATSNSDVAQTSSPLTGGGQQRPPGGGGFR